MGKLRTASLPFLAAALLGAMAGSCAHEQAAPPAPIETPALTEAAPLPATEPAPPQAPASEPPVLVVSEELRQSTFMDVSGLISSLNAIIRRRDFDAWRALLTDEYLGHYSDPRTLAELSQQPALRRYNIVLKSLRDYFAYVVYPSRQNDRVDDIEFIDERRLVAYTINAKEERLVLYNLEKIGDTWKIAIWR